MFVFQNTYETAKVLKKMPLRRATRYLKNVIAHKECVPFTKFSGGVGRCAQVNKKLKLSVFFFSKYTATHDQVARSALFLQSQRCTKPYVHARYNELIMSRHYLLSKETNLGKQIEECEL